MSPLRELGTEMYNKSVYGFGHEHDNRRAEYMAREEDSSVGTLPESKVDPVRRGKER